jgi:hypothetical protein
MRRHQELSTVLSAPSGRLLPVTTAVWRPLGLEPSDSPTYDALHDGVPPWMEESFWGWMKVRFTTAKQANYGQTVRSLNIELLRQVERKCRIKLEYRGSALNEAISFIRARTQESGTQLVVADYLLSFHSSEEAQELLETILHESRSMWKVGHRSDSPGLVRRVPEGVQTAVDGTISSSGHAGMRLSEAWAAAFGIAPDPSRAYSLAVKAVEDAAIPVVSPNDATATLGKINSQMRNTGNWGLPLAREDEHATTSTTLLSMMKMLWAGQADRHGGHHDRSLVITQEAAETAVISAATLVQWFASGAVARRQ